VELVCCRVWAGRGPEPIGGATYRFYSCRQAGFSLLELPI